MYYGDAQSNTMMHCSFMDKTLRPQERVKELKKTLGSASIRSAPRLPITPRAFEQAFQLR